MECNCNAVVFLEDQEHQTHFLKNLREKAAERLASGTSRVFGNPFLASRCAALPHLAKKAKAKAQEEGPEPETPQKIPAKKKEKEAKKKEKKEAKEKKKSSPKKNKEKGKKKKTSEDPESKKKKKKGEEAEEESSTDDESSSDGESSSD